jgi:hypothetical protein
MNKIDIKLTKISRPDIEGGLRTNSVEGKCYSLPIVGNQFEMTAPPLESGDIRFISTNFVESVIDTGKVIRFTTRTGSVYELEVL